ncbi:10470_t:CDS:2, partial [Funneliformis geosporum]
FAAGSVNNGAIAIKFFFFFGTMAIGIKTRKHLNKWAKEQLRFFLPPYSFGQYCHGEAQCPQKFGSERATAQFSGGQLPALAQKRALNFYP